MGYDQSTPAQQAIREAAGQGYRSTQPTAATEDGAPSEEQSISDMIVSMTSEEERDKLRAICGILNAFTLAKHNVTGSPYWTVEDLYAFALATRALNNTWATAEQAKLRLATRRRA